MNVKEYEEGGKVMFGVICFGVWAILMTLCIFKNMRDIEKLNRKKEVK